MSIKKQFLKTRPICKVTFRLTKDEITNAKSAHITGEFNGWEKPGMPMKALKNGDFTVTLDLEKDRDYQFRYLIDNELWINEREADKYVDSGFTDSDNSVVSV